MITCEACQKALRDLRIVASLLKAALTYEEPADTVQEAHDRVSKLIVHLESTLECS